MKPLSAADLGHVIDNTCKLWDKVRGKKIFLSGATGFFGIWLLESMAYCNRNLNLDLSAVVLCRDPVRFREQMPHIAQESCIQFLKGDVRTFDFPPEEFEYLIHAAAPTIAPSSLDAEELLSILIDGTRRILAFAKSRGTQRMLFVSSGAVYGQQPSGVKYISEDYRGGPDWINPDSSYAEGKRVSEQLCAIAARKLPIQMAIARCFAFVGPHLPLHQHFAIGNFIANALANEPILIRGDGTPMRSYLYASDLAVWLWTLLLADPRQSTNPTVINVGSSNAVSIHDLARLVARVLNPTLEIRIEEKPRDGALSLQYVPDARRAEALYGLRESISLEQAIRHTAEWHRS